MSSNRISGYKKFQEIYHRESGERVQVYIGTKGDQQGKFRAEYGADICVCDNFGDVEKWVNKAISDASGLVWTPVILAEVESEVSYRRGEEKRSGLSITYERFYIAKRSDGLWIRSRWSSPDRLRDSHVLNIARGLDLSVLPAVANHNRYNSSQNPEYYLPYSDEMWAMLKWVGEQLGNLHGIMDAMIGSEGGRDALLRGSQGGGNLLQVTAGPGAS